MAPTLEVAFNLIEKNLEQGQYIIGLYENTVQANQVIYLFKKITEQSIRIVSSISAMLQKDAMVVKLSSVESNENQISPIIEVIS